MLWAHLLTLPFGALIENRLHYSHIVLLNNTGFCVLDLATICLQNRQIYGEVGPKI